MIVRRWLPPQCKLEELSVLDYFFNLAEATLEMERKKAQGSQEAVRKPRTVKK